MRVKMQLVFFLLAHFRTIWFILSILLKRCERLHEELITCIVFKIRVSKSLWKVRRSLLVLRSVSEGQMCSLCRWDTFLSRAPELASVLIFYSSSVLSPSLCSVAAMYRAWTGSWAGHRRYRAQPGHTGLTISYNQQHSFASQNIRRKERKFTVA